MRNKMFSKLVTINIYGDLSINLKEKINQLFAYCHINCIEPNNIIEIDKAIRDKNPLIFMPCEKDPLSFLTAYLAEWRVLDPWLKKLRKAIVYNKNEYFEHYFKTKQLFRANLRDEKNPDAKYKFVYPDTTIDDFFHVATNEDQLISFLAMQIETVKEIKIEMPTVVTEMNIESLRQKFTKAHVFVSKEEYFSSTINNNNEKPAVFVPTFASDNIYLEDLARNVGKTIAEAGFRFINGGPDGGQRMNGPMRSSAIGAKSGGADMVAVYSLSILNKYVSPNKIDKFEGISIIPTLTEAERKLIMLNESSVVIALPGAIGTLAEIEDAIRLNKYLILIEDEAIHNGKGFWSLEGSYFKQIGMDHFKIIKNSTNLAIDILNVLHSHKAKTLRNSTATVSSLQHKEGATEQTNDTQFKLG